MTTRDAGAETQAENPSRERFETLLRPVLPLAFRYAVRLAGDRDCAMDVVQDASVSAYRAFGQFRPGTNFKAWYLRILTNAYFLSRKSEVRSSAVPIDDVPELFLYRQVRRLGASTLEDPFESLLREVDGRAICEALDRLPDEYRAVATLHFLTEMTYEECAETLDAPIGTVRSRLHRARRLLQFSLWRIAEERGYVPKTEEAN
jgi:RNA polymerase sigma-70 factor (ECF subfamily)